MRTRTTAVVLVALVVLAGCAGSASDVATTTSGETTSDAQRTDLPPGVNESGVENASALATAHRTALSESGYAFRLDTNVSYGDQFNYDVSYRGTVAKNFAPFRIRADADVDARDERLKLDTWANESVALVRYRTANRTAFQKYNTTLDETPDSDPFSSVPTVNVADRASMTSVVEYALLTGEYEVAGVESRDGLTLTTLRATGHNQSLGERGLENVSRYDSTLVVDDRGRVHRLNTTLETNESLVSYEFELTKVGGVVVEYPRWADRALATVSVAVTIQSAENYFVVAHQDGERLPAGSEIRVSHAGSNYILELDEPLRPGEQVYIYFSRGDDTPFLTREEPAEDTAEPLDGEYEFEVVDPDGNTLLNSGFGFGRSNESANETATTTTTVGE